MTARANEPSIIMLGGRNPNSVPTNDFGRVFFMASPVRCRSERIVRRTWICARSHAEFIICTWRNGIFTVSSRLRSRPGPALAERDFGGFGTEKENFVRRRIAAKIHAKHNRVLKGCAEDVIDRGG
ncbi:hypothetical protein GEV33_005914 [Tenebrio molitor]|uniref:Uncharacterized protein n=1 Tax=Tenebrio molitor TaxID=7067 RepID=A0A8J6LEI2_TENMO|nr:hypothetical protein GEV33_005914 [Tenebrio molitor]